MQSRTNNQSQNQQQSLESPQNKQERQDKPNKENNFFESNKQFDQNKLVTLVIGEILDQSFVLSQTVPQNYEFTFVEHFQEPNILEMISNFINKNIKQSEANKSQQVANKSLGQSLFGKILAGTEQNITNYRKQAVSQFIEQVKTPQSILQTFIDSIASRNDILEQSDIISNDNIEESMTHPIQHFIQIDSANQQIADQIISTFVQKALLKKALNMEIVNEAKQQQNCPENQYVLKLNVPKQNQNYPEIIYNSQIDNKQLIRKTELLQQKVSHLEAVLKRFEEKQEKQQKLSQRKRHQNHQQLKKRQSPLINKTLFLQDSSNNDAGDSQAKTIFKSRTKKSGRNKSTLGLTSTIQITVNQKEKYENSLNPYFRQAEKLRAQIKNLQNKNKSLQDMYEKQKKKIEEIQSSMKKSTIQRDRSQCGTIYTISHSKDFRIKKLDYKHKNEEIDNYMLSANILNFDDEDKIADFQRKQLKSFQSAFNVELKKIPQAPSEDSSEQQLMILAQKCFQIFGLNLGSTEETLTIRKYRNCVLMKLKSQANILWHFDGRFYFGGWEQKQDGGERNGQGYEYVPQKYVYQGQFKNGKRNGTGKLKLLTSNSVYIGEWLNGVKNGRGSQKDQAGIYQGQWKQGKKDGLGKISIIDTEGNLSKYSFEGNFEKGLKNGYGIEYFQNGDYYKGDYFNGKFHGKGFYLWHTGAKYEGQFREGVRQGIGKWISASGDSYQGSYKRNIKDGFGIYKWKDGSTYQGFFQKDLQRGQGRFINSHGQQRKGNWQNGKLSRDRPKSKINSQRQSISKQKTREVKQIEKLTINFNNHEREALTSQRKNDKKSNKTFSSKKKMHSNKFSLDSASSMQL